MGDVNPLTRELLTYSLIKGVGRATLRKLGAAHTVSGELLSNSPATLRSLLEEPETLARAQAAAELQLETAERHNARILSPFDDAYPSLLRELPDRPELLFVRGDLMPSVDAPAVAIIGTRNPTRAGRTTAEHLATQVTEHGSSVISGLATGIDEVAHRACLDANGHTVAVLAHGLDSTYPKQNAALAESIVSTGGVLVTEYPFGTQPRGPRFVARDRLQAGLACAVMLVQTDLTGGSWHAAQAIMRYHRLLAYPVPVSEDVEAEAGQVRGLIRLHQAGPTERARMLAANEPGVEERIEALTTREDVSVFMQSLATRCTRGATSRQEPLFRTSP